MIALVCMKRVARKRVVRKHMVEYLEANSLLTNKQHGFRANRSCLTQMHGDSDDIYEGFTCGEDFRFYLSGLR